MAEYVGLALFTALGTGIVLLFMVLTWWLGPKLRFDEKMEPFECGEKQIVSPFQRFNIKFYLVAVSFIIFDVEIVFLYPWSILFRDFIGQGVGWYGFIVMSVFLFIITVGLAYEWMKGGLDWN